MVLHDIPSGAMAHLEKFLSRAREAGAQFVQEFPPECMPLDGGVATPKLADYVTDEAARAAA